MGSITLENTNSWPDSAKPLSVRGGKPPTQVYRLRLFSSGAAEQNGNLLPGASPVQDRLVLLFLWTRTAQDPLPGLGVLGLPLGQ